MCFADPSRVSLFFLFHCAAAEKITYIKDDDTYHTLKSVGRSPSCLPSRDQSLAS